MRKIVAAAVLLSLSAFTLYAQDSKTAYPAKWRIIDSLIAKKGLTKSALQEVNNVYSYAKKEKNNEQLIKALLYKMNLQELQWEDAAKINIDALHEEITTISEPAKSILESIQAENYWNYFQQNRWKLYNRTRTFNASGNDIATWTAEDFHQKISELFLASLTNERLLKQTKPESFAAIIIKGNVPSLRPTLFDLLAHRALEYFKNDEIDLNKPAYAFEINNPEVFADKAIFSGYHFSSPDSASLHFIALRLFQELISFHDKDAKHDALLDVDIERIQFANQYAVMDNKEEWYVKALENITAKYGTEPVAAQAWYLLAEQFARKAGRYDAAKDTAYRYDYLKAKSICQQVIAEKDSSEGKSNCEILLSNILRKDLRLQTEKVNVPGQPFRALVAYKNFAKLYFRIIPLEHQQKLNLLGERWQQDYWDKLVKLPSEKTFLQTFPETGDNQLHRAEIKIDSLSVGEYALVASVDENFSMQKNLMAVEYFYVSEIAFVNNGLDYFVLNRQSGQPIAKADVQFWYPYYDQREKRYLERKGENIISDQNGFFQVNPPKTKSNNSYRIELTTIGDHLFLDDEIPTRYYRSDNNDDANNKTSYEGDNLKTFFFTDRSIYRPGQTIYFKGIILTKDFNTRKSKILTGFSTKVVLYDANGQKVDSLSLSTNDFGSYNGKFRLPENLLNGEFKIADDSTGNEQSFSVEEYKRPKFYVQFEKPKATFHVNDSISVAGAAKAYAGNLIGGAAVKYRVVRQARYPYPWLYWRWENPSGGSQEIAHGETKTDAEGKFLIGFQAIPDNSIKKEWEPVFEYSVLADITDVNGETRSGETLVPVGYQALTISIHLPGESIAADSLKSILVKTENLSGEYEPANLSVVIYKLKSPTRLIRERYWEEPDQFVMGRDVFLKNFPFDEYSNESHKQTWEKTDKVFEGSDSTRPDGEFSFNTLGRIGPQKSFVPGWYVIEARTKDRYGEAVQNIAYIELDDSKTGAPASPRYDWVLGNDQSLEPGNKATINIGSSANNVFVIEQVNNKGELKEYLKKTNDSSFKDHFLILSNEKKSIIVPITESDRGGIGIDYVFVKDNRLYSGSHIIAVPWTNKELGISYESFRDKTLPGSQEKWKIKITGNKKEKVAAEVLLAMYDASLDQFKPQSWEKPDIYFNYNSENNWGITQNFLATQSQEKVPEDNSNYFFQKNYDRLLGVSMGMRTIRLRGISSEPQIMEGRIDGQLISGSERKFDQVVVTAKGYSAQGKKAFSLADTALATDSGVGLGYPSADRLKKPDQFQIQIRKNFNETAFFFPGLRTDSSGSLEFLFTMPEAVTQWKWMTFAHSRDLAFGYSEKNIVTQKQLMVQPNLPRFLREGDKISLSAKIVNLTDSEMTGQTELQLFDATSNQPVDGLFINREANQYFTADAKQSVAVNFSIDVPYQFNKPVTYRIIARSKDISDGEEAALPVLSNRILVTETLPLNMRGTGTKNFKFEKLLQSAGSETLNHHALTVEFTASPAWYAVQALPYLMEFPYECAEQTFNRFYANAVAAAIVKSSTRIRQVFEKWKTADTTALISNLQKNQELKSVLLEETPWVLASKDESQQKRNIALLFDMTRLDKESVSALNKLRDLQLGDGSFPWFKGGTADRYITQYILIGFGHLKKMNALPEPSTQSIDLFLSAAISYLDKKIKEDFDQLIKTNPSGEGLGDIQIQYLYMRSFFAEYPIPGETFKAMNYYRSKAKQSWLQQNKYMQAMIALALFRTGEIKTSKDILASLKQQAIINEESGMYWKDITGGYYWYQSPVETEALLIEAFREIGGDDRSVDNMKTWLLKQKQTQDWKTTRATADACYALLLQGKDLLGAEKKVQIRLGSTVINSDNLKDEAGTGYFKKTFDGNFVKADMGNISLSVLPQTGQTAGTSWGAVYWQYFENLDKITPAATPLRISKKLFIETNSDRGLVLEPLEENATVKTGDKIKVRIELRVDRNMEYVHMKDMRASCLEPVNLLSGYQWQGGLGYYQSTKDASTNFFFGWLPRGTYVFEYALYVTAMGNFSNGITTVQCMYAPEFTATSEGIRITAE